jgi:hypothetical protein
MSIAEPNEVFSNLWNRKNIIIGSENPQFLNGIDRMTNSALKILGEELTKIGKLEEFNVSFYPGDDLWIRDIYMAGKNGLIIPDCKEEKELDNKVYLSKMKSLYSKENCRLLPYHPDSNYFLSVKSAGNIKEYMEDIQDSFLIFEGGNFIRAYRVQNEPILLGGCDNCYATFVAWQKEKEEKTIPNFDEIKACIQDTLQQLEENKLLTDSLLKTNQEYLLKAYPSTDKQVSPYQDLNSVKEAIAELEVIKKEFQKKMGVPIVWIPDMIGFGGDQPGFHIDLHLIGLPNGKVGIQSSEATLKIIDKNIKSLMDSENLKIFSEEWKRSHLFLPVAKYQEAKKLMKDNIENTQYLNEYTEVKKRYQIKMQETFKRIQTKIPDLDKQTFSQLSNLFTFQRCAKILQIDEKNRIDKVILTLEKHQLKPILIPAHYYKPINNSEQGIYSFQPVINYANAIVGKGKEEKFLITMKFKSIVDDLLSNAFKKEITKHGVKVYFIGNTSQQNTSTENTYKNYWVGSHLLYLEGGLHCLTNEF